jgi:hypothetical protein
MVFSIQVGSLYRPNEAKVKNLKSKDYLGKARLVASAEANLHGHGGNADAKRVFDLACMDTSELIRLRISCWSRLQETTEHPRPSRTQRQTWWILDYEVEAIVSSPSPQSIETSSHQLHHQKRNLQ